MRNTAWFPRRFMSAVWLLVPLVAASPAETTSARVLEPQSPDVFAPRLSRSLDAPLLLGGTVAFVFARAVSEERREVPVEGLDRAGIRWAMDRRSVRMGSARADRASDVAMGMASAYPLILRYATAPAGARFDEMAIRVVPLAEATILTHATAVALKRAVSRPRPFTYQPDDQRPSDARAEIEHGGAFRSFPSGHAAQAYCGAAFAVADHLRSRPLADWKEHAIVGFAGGAMAAGTSMLRIDAARHFPTDVVAGAAIGSLWGAGVVLLHPYEPAPLSLARFAPRESTGPPARSVIAAVAGTLAGSAVVVLLATAVN